MYVWTLHLKWKRGPWRSQRPNEYLVVFLSDVAGEQFLNCTCVWFTKKCVHCTYTGHECWMWICKWTYSSTDKYHSNCSNMIRNMKVYYECVTIVFNWEKKCDYVIEKKSWYEVCIEADTVLTLMLLILKSELFFFFITSMILTSQYYWLLLRFFLSGLVSMLQRTIGTLDIHTFFYSII